ncbi:MAG: HlyC/CorC family transporter [Alphaproteobacteria bacterium]|nr:HlyC/CorC family transporter [Alphaproteobacteria bacterium]MCB9697899.1 HlyC/CorC family transporter [Alphaproteobacteria bacterium]
MRPLLATGGVGLDLEAGPATVVALLLMLVFSFFFSGTETAYFGLQKPDRERFENGTNTQRQVAWLLSRRAALITAILLGNELANTSIAATTGAIFSEWAPRWPWLNVVVVPPLLVLVSEITPKIIAYRFRTVWTQVVAWPLTAWLWAVTPIRVVFATLLSLVQRAIGAEERNESVAEEELLVYVDRGMQQGELDPNERDIIEAVFEFDDLVVKRLMTPRPDIFSVPLNTPWQELLRLARAQGYSRIPVTGASPDDVIGVLLLKDLLKFRARPLDNPKQLRALLLPPVLVPDTKPADGMLREFLERRFHMAFVVNEHGTLVGLVTLDDLLGELLGTEEDDPENLEIDRNRPGTMTVKASVDLEDFAEETGIELPMDDGYVTLGGFVFHQLGRLPRKGDVVSHGAHEFVVGKMEGRRVAEILVTTREATSEEAPAEPRERADQEAG